MDRPCTRLTGHLGSEIRKLGSHQSQRGNPIPVSQIASERPYTEEDVQRLRGSVVVEHTLGRLGAERLRRLLEEE